MTSMPASRRARAITLTPRSCPSSPGFATTTRIVLGLPFGIVKCPFGRLRRVSRGEMIRGVFPHPQRVALEPPFMARTAAGWIDLVLDPGWSECDAGLAAADPLGFPGYSKRDA